MQVQLLNNFLLFTGIITILGSFGFCFFYSKFTQKKYNKIMIELRDIYEKALQENKIRVRRSLYGIGMEKIAPFLVHYKYNPSDSHFLGNPIDYVVFDGISIEKLEKIVFVEIKSGNSELTRREKMIRDIIKEGKVSFEVLRINGEPNV